MKALRRLILSPSQEYRASDIVSQFATDANEEENEKGLDANEEWKMELTISSSWPLFLWLCYILMRVWLCQIWCDVFPKIDDSKEKSYWIRIPLKSMAEEGSSIIYKQQCI